MIRNRLAGNQTLFIENLDHLERLAHVFAGTLQSGDFVALTGTLGSGKTTFVQALCTALGYPDKVTSPTFTLFNEYPLDDFRILHVDCYRLQDSEIEASLLEWEGYFDQPGTVVLMEWADRAPQLDYRWTSHLHLAHHPQNEHGRILTLSCDSIPTMEALSKAVTHES